MSSSYPLAATAPATPETPPHTGGLLLLIDGTAGLLTVAALGIALLLVLIIKARLQPFVALLAVSIAVGLAAGLSVTELFGTVQRSTAVSVIETGMGGILGHVAIIIGLGTMLGAILEVSGGAEVLASRLLNLFGEKRAPLAMGLTGLIFGIPVFFDVGIFVLAPIVYAAAKRSGKSILLYCLPLLGRPVDDARLPAAAPGPGRRRGTAPRAARLGHPHGHRLRHPRRARRLGLRRVDRQADLRRRTAGHGRGRRRGEARRHQRAARGRLSSPRRSPYRSARFSASSVRRWC